MKSIMRRYGMRRYGMTRFGLLAIVALATTSLISCKHEKPNVIFMPDMVYSQAYKAQEEGSMRNPVPGTMAREQASYSYADPLSAAANKNPYPRNMDTLLRGKLMYETYCLVCHGVSGEGDGSVVPKFPRPPSLQSDKIRGYADGSIFHVMTKGQNLMPSYAAQVQPSDRWAIVHYIRALHRSKKPTPEDLKAFEEARK